MRRIAILLVIALILSADMSTTNPSKGIGMAYMYPEDLIRMKADWWYVWGGCPTNTPSGCVPMSYDGESPNLPLSYSGYVLLFNEPDNPPPFGGTLTPKEAIVKYMKLCDEFSNVKWVVGNVNIFYRMWMHDFWSLCKATPGCIMPKYLGWHIYISTENEAKHLHLFLDGMQKLEFPNTRWWITEFADITGNISNDDIMVNEFKKRDWIERWAYFTNRASEEEGWYPIGWDVQLFDWETGEMTAIGKWYANDVHKEYLPIIQR
jgi:hypothetical protein